MTMSHLKSKRFCLSLLLTLILVGVLLAMGAWQVQRLQWKTALVKSINDPAAIAAAPNLPFNAVSPSTPEPVMFFGQYLPEYSIFVRNQDVMTVYMPFQTNDGGLIMMRRGTVPAGRVSGQILEYSENPGQISVVGVPVPKPSSLPLLHETNPQGLIWTFLDWDALQGKLKEQPPLAPYMVVVLEEPKSAMPLVRTPPELRNDHLQYAIFWFTMALVAAVLFGRFLLLPKRGE